MVSVICQFKIGAGYPWSGPDTKFFLLNLSGFFMALAKGKSTVIEYTKTPVGIKMNRLFDLLNRWNLSVAKGDIYL